MSDPKSYQFQPSDLDRIKEYAQKEWLITSLPMQFEGMKRPLTDEEFRVYCIMAGTMRWMHGKGLVNGDVIFKTVQPDSLPEAEDPDWIDHEPDPSP